MPKIKVIDSIIYNGETAVELRLKYLYDVVDEFIITESRETHSGNLKGSLYLEQNTQAFKPYESKITKLIIDKFPEEESTVHFNAADKKSFSREHYQRDYAYNYYLKDKYKDQRYILFCCDADEIPRKELYQNYEQLYQEDCSIHMGMKMFCYNFKWLQFEYEWFFPFIVNDKVIGNHPLSKYRMGAHGYKTMANSGWHLSYFESVNGLARKLESFAHTELNKDNIKDKDYIRSCMLSGRFFLDYTGNNILVRYTNNDLPTGWEELERKLEDKIYNEYIIERSIKNIFGNQ